MDRKTLLAVAVIGLIILLTPYYYNMIAPPPADTPEAVGEVDSLESAQEPSPVPGEAAEDEADRAPRQPMADPLSASDVATGERPWFAADDPLQAREIVVETPLYRAVFSSYGASLRSFVIKPAQPYIHEPEQLVRQDIASRNLVLISRGGSGLLRTEEKLFEVQQSDLRISQRSGPQSLVFELPLPGGRVYRESYTFHPDSYEIEVKLESKGLGELIGASSATFSWGGGLSYTEEDTLQDATYARASMMVGNSKEEIKPAGKEEETEEATGPTSWVAQRTKYFLMALVPDSPADGARLSAWPPEFSSGRHTPALFETALEFNIAGTGDLDQGMTLYLGPLDQSMVVAAEPSLEQTMNWGWVIVEPFSKAVYHILVFFHRFIPNYGVVLILFSVLVKLVVFPLTHKSYKSMKRMQVLQPYLKQVQEQYKDNPQEMQKRVMALYKEYKVNPMGGCWPVLLQMPLLYGLFMVFRSTIELRGQPFMLWISDLSQPDILFHLPFAIPLYGDHVAILPLVMAVSTYLQSKQTMTDPNQKMMLYMMPAMFIFLFNNFPSGLTLYYTLFNLLSWAQQKLLKIEDPQLTALAEKAEEEREKQEQRDERRRQKQQRRNED